MATTQRFLRRSCVLVLLGAGAAAVLALSGRGPLDPPSGPIAPTGPTMIFSIPYTISVPGSYVVVRDLPVPTTATDGITITASDVTLDLGGFRLTGIHGGSANHHGVNITGSRATVRNGFIYFWTGSGVNIGASSSGCVVEKVTFESNYSLADNGTAAAVAGTGAGTAVVGCTAMDSNERGFILGPNARVLDCTVLSIKNTVSVGDGSLVARCTVNHAGQPLANTALATGLRCEVRDCVVLQPTTGLGVSLGDGSSLLDTTVRAFASGVVSTANCTLSRVTVTGSVGTAFTIGDNSIVSDCLASRSTNSGTGMTIANGVTLTACRVSGGDVGIAVTGSGCRVEGNHVIGLGSGTIGIQITGTNNFIARNGVRNPEGTEYSIGRANSYGPLVTVTGVGDISGTADAAHSWANFRY